MDDDQKELLIRHKEKSSKYLEYYLISVEKCLYALHTSISNATDGNIVTGLLIREWLEMVDAIEHLFKENKIPPAMILTRTAFEVLMQLQYLNDGDTDEKAACFNKFVSYKNANSIENLIKINQKNGKTNNSELEKILKESKKNFEKTNSQAEKIAKDKLLARKKHGYPRGWYHVYDQKITSIAGLARNINDSITLSLYELTYNYLSMYAHGTQSGNNIFVLPNGQSFLKSFGNPQNGVIVLNFIHEMFLAIIELLKKQYPSIGWDSIIDISILEKQPDLMNEIRDIEHNIDIF